MNSKALLRMIEAVLAAIVILTAFTLSYYYSASPNPFTVRAKGDLEKLAYDVLHRLAEEKAFDEAIEKSPSIWMDQIAAALRTLLPKNIIYNLTIYQAVKSTENNVNLIPIGRSTTNIENYEEAVIRASEMGGATLTYSYSSLENGEFYVLILHLTLARTER
ncbi:MAG: hypothetical protein QXY40_10000 [Candidatus Methanomethylicia archaeon]